MAEAVILRCCTSCGRAAAMFCRKNLLSFLAVFVLIGCGATTQLETSKGVSHWAGLRTACSAEDTVRLEQAAKALDSAHQAGEITEKEHQLLSRVVTVAREKNWKEAIALCQKIHSLNL